MLGDVLLLNSNHDKAAKDIYNIAIEKLSKRRKKKYIVAISGESGAGKSEVAHRLAEFIKESGMKAKVLHIDNYYKIPPNKRHQWRLDNKFRKIGINEYNWQLINENISDFKKGRISILPCIDRLTDQNDTLITNFKDIEVLVIEGIYAIRARADLRVYIDLTYVDTKLSQIERRKEALNDFRLRVLEKEHKAVSKLRPKANYLITKTFDVILNSDDSIAEIHLPQKVSQN